jgi:Fe-S cluster assembly iron-binding protein IscA
MLVINQDAAEFLLNQIAKNPECKQPLRLKQKQKGCGDIAHEFTHAPVTLPGDTVVEEFGLTIICNFDHAPDFEHATIALVAHPNGTFAKQKIVVIPEGAHLCGCGESAALPKKEK